jgi:hypothetical protein
MLGENGADANLQSGLDRFRHIVRGQHKDWDGRKEVPKNLGRLEAIHHGHGKIQDDEIGLQVLSLGNGVDAIFGFSAYNRWQRTFK